MQAVSGVVEREERDAAVADECLVRAEAVGAEGDSQAVGAPASLSKEEEQ